ncbi:MAG: acetate/propionate family kinase [Acidimicrobiales bacterium]
MRVLVVNAGSSTLKLSVLDEGNLLSSELVEAPDGEVDMGAFREVVAGHGPIEAVGHRFVHGGSRFTAPVLIDPDVVRALEGLVDLAPLHQPMSLRGLDLTSQIVPGVPAVACFDTAFHATMSPAAATYALPAEWRRRWDLRRFGFHGLSHSYASRRAAAMMEGGALRVVTCHLGAGASLAAVRGGFCVDTTMGFTPLEGLVMATRSGSVDAGLLLWLEDHEGLSSREINNALLHRSGLLGLAGNADMRAVLAAEQTGDQDAVLAMAVYLHRLRAGIAAMVAALGGLDALVFTAGIGEHSAPVRRRAADGLGFLGVALDEAANESAKPDQEVSASGAPVRTFVVEAREDLEIVRGVQQVLAGH